MEKEFYVLAHNIRSLHNVGSIFRTADVFGVDKLFLSGYTGIPPDPKIAKVALNADSYVPWEYKKSAVAVIKSLRKIHPKLTIIGLENNVPKVLQKRLIFAPKFRPKFPLLLILGEETKGIPKTLATHCDKFLEIPQQGKKESLNVSVAFGAAAYVIWNN